MLAKYFPYLLVIRFLDTEFDRVGCYRLIFYLAVFCLAGILFVDGVNIFDIYVALFVVRVFLGQALMSYVRPRQLGRMIVDSGDRLIRQQLEWLVAEIGNQDPKRL